MTPRKNPMAIRYKVIDVEGHKVVIHVVDDIEDEYLQKHFDNALARNDFEYCQAIKIEADKRKIKIIV